MTWPSKRERSKLWEVRGADRSSANHLLVTGGTKRTFDHKDYSVDASRRRIHLVDKLIRCMLRAFNLACLRLAHSRFSLSISKVLQLFFDQISEYIRNLGEQKHGQTIEISGVIGGAALDANGHFSQHNCLINSTAQTNAAHLQKKVPRCSNTTISAIYVTFTEGFIKITQLSNRKPNYLRTIDQVGFYRKISCIRSGTKNTGRPFPPSVHCLRTKSL